MYMAWDGERQKKEENAKAQRNKCSECKHLHARTNQNIRTKKKMARKLFGKKPTTRLPSTSLSAHALPLCPNSFCTLAARQMFA